MDESIQATVPTTNRTYIERLKSSPITYFFLSFVSYSLISMWWEARNPGGLGAPSILFAAYYLIASSGMGLIYLFALILTILVPTGLILLSNIPKKPRFILAIGFPLFVWPFLASLVSPIGWANWNKIVVANDTKDTKYLNIPFDIVSDQLISSADLKLESLAPSKQVQVTAQVYVPTEGDYSFSFELYESIGGRYRFVTGLDYQDLIITYGGVTHDARDPLHFTAGKQQFTVLLLTKGISISDPAIIKRDPLVYSERDRMLREDGPYIIQAKLNELTTNEPVQNPDFDFDYFETYKSTQRKELFSEQTQNIAKYRNGAPEQVYNTQYNVYDLLDQSPKATLDNGTTLYSNTVIYHTKPYSLADFK